MDLHHINVKGPRDLLEEEKKFFCEVLGLREGLRPNFPSQGYWLYSGDKPIVHLTESEKHFENEKQGYFDHVAFQSKNLKRFVQHLRDKNLDYTGVYLQEIGMSQIFLKSPSGTGIEVNFENENIEGTL